MKKENRYVVRITCNQCGEHYILKGRLRKGKVETGFKSCLCNNRENFEVRQEPL
jgi:hypothetical protein